MPDEPPRTSTRRPRPLAEVVPFAMLYVGEVHELTATMSLQQHRVFFGLIRQMAYNSSFRYSTGRLAREVGMHPAKVSLAIRQLKELGVVLHVGPERDRVYLNPRFVWNGDRRGRALAILELLPKYAASTFMPNVDDLKDDLEAGLADEEPTPEEDR